MKMEDFIDEKTILESTTAIALISKSLLENFKTFLDQDGCNIHPEVTPPILIGISDEITSGMSAMCDAATPSQKVVAFKDFVAIIMLYEPTLATVKEFVNSLPE